MIFESYLREFKSEVQFAVRELFKAAIKNQTHTSDIFLISIHGFFQKEIDESRGKPGSLNLSPYVFGPGTEAYEQEHASDRFYYQVRSQIKSGDREKFYNYKKSDPNWETEWSINVQVEMYAYLKFWESDMILKKLTQLVRLVTKEHYDWKLTFKKPGKSRGPQIEVNIIEKAKDKCPKFYELMKLIYDRKLRNAIAHSQYFFMGDKIILTGRKDKPYYTLDEWDTLINKFILFYDYLNYYVQIVEHYFKKKAVDRHFGNQVRIAQNGSKSKFEWITLMDDNQRWIWYKTWADYYRRNFFIA